MALFTLEEFADYVQSEVNTDTATIARDLATGIVEAECGRSWTADATPVAKIRRVDPSGRVILPRPVASVDDVKFVELDGTVSTASYAGWTFDGIDTVRLAAVTQVLNMSVGDDTADYNDTVQITWTPGVATAPAAVVAVALALAARIQSNPSGASTLGIDDYQQGWSGGGGTVLLPQERATLARYRTRGLSSQGVTA